MPKPPPLGCRRSPRSLMLIRVRIALLALGVIAFTIAMRTQLEWVRWIGIVLVAAALLLRFVRR